MREDKNSPFTLIDGPAPLLSIYTQLSMEGYQFNTEISGHALRKYEERTAFSSKSSRSTTAILICKSLVNESLADLIVNEIPVGKTATIIVRDKFTEIAYAMSINTLRYAIHVSTVFTFYKSVLWYDEGDFCIIVGTDGIASFADESSTEFALKNRN